MKNAITYILFSLLAFNLMGCADVVQKTYGSNRAGTVRYSTDWFMGQKNRKKAVEEMKDYCAPSRPRLLAEDSQAEFSGSSYSDSNFSKHGMYTTTTQSKEHYVYLHFKCVKPKV